MYSDVSSFVFSISAIFSWFWVCFYNSVVDNCIWITPAFRWDTAQTLSAEHDSWHPQGTASLQPPMPFPEQACVSSHRSAACLPRLGCALSTQLCLWQVRLVLNLCDSPRYFLIECVLWKTKLNALKRPYICEDYPSDLWNKANIERIERPSFYTITIGEFNIPLSIMAMQPNRKSTRKWRIWIMS